MNFRQEYNNHRTTAIVCIMASIMYGFLPLYVLRYSTWWVYYIFWFNVAAMLLSALHSYYKMKRAKRYIIRYFFKRNKSTAMKQLWYYLLMAAILCMVYIKSGAQQIATAQDFKIIHIDSLKFDSSLMIFKNKPVDTPKLIMYGGIIYSNNPVTSVEYGSQGFRVIDSTGTVATRDTCGNWVIKDAARSLEVMYQLFIKKYEMRIP